MKKRSPAGPKDHMIVDAQTGAELYLTSDEAEAVLSLRRLGKNRDLKLLRLTGTVLMRAVVERGVVRGWVNEDSSGPRAPDPRALAILAAAHWGPGGWKDTDERSVSASDHAYAKRMGLMFDPVKLTHDQTIARLRAAISAVTRADVANAFLASLSSRRVEWRSALASYARGHAFKDHASNARAPEALNRSTDCTECGIPVRASEHDLDVLSFERYKWGGVRHDEPVYIALDLECLAANGIPEPTGEDVKRLRAILDALRSALPATEAHLERAIVPHVDGNKAERSTLIEILIHAGIVARPEKRGQRAKVFDEVVRSWFGELV